jgi:hypothetical protein
MKLLPVAAGLLFVPTAVFGTLDAYPKTTLAELATATWCGYCPDAYQGLEIVHSVYDYSEFISARYYASSGSYGTAETDAAIAYYNITGYPTAIINGTERFVGGGAGIATGLPYLGAVGSAYFTPAPARVEIDSLDLVTGYARAIVTMYAPDDSLEGTNLRFLLIEDDVSGHHTHVTRDIVNDTISLTGQGNTAIFETSFDVNPAWNKDNLFAVALVQDADQTVLQAFSTRPSPAYKIRAMVPSSMMQIGPSAGTFEGDLFTVVNVGLTDDYTLNVALDKAPDGWSVAYFDEQGTQYTEPSAFTLGTEQYVKLGAAVSPSSPGLATYHFEVTSTNLDTPLVIPFTYITDDIDALVVDDDGGEPFENYFTAALDSAGLTYGVWDLAASKLTEEVASTFTILVWNVGWSFPSLDATDRGFLKDYLDAGGHLFLSGQDIGWDLNESSDNQDPSFYHDYLHARYLRDDTNIYYVDGVPGDPVSDGLTLHIAGGDGANNQQYPSEIEAYDEDATEIFYYQADGAGAIRAEDTDSGAKIVYLAFGFEAIDNPPDRTALMSAAIEWFRKITGTEEGELPPSVLTLAQNRPNPFSSATTFSYFLPRSAVVDLSVYDIAGRQVKTLVKGSEGAGHTVVRWDGTDDARRPLADGLYVYKLRVNGRCRASRKCLKIR